ncbi:hypothetical protein HYQ45_008356 [Verticillium longisporum]|uniref:Uncharacterized protein n=1 Tax=Verticillium longisporum TaxID=100787 RepID=A0A0G4L3G6_VERLO|nr:hypothetical protein HYQ45_008356 [Verticillium longisporum]CRK16554.1 hypothetical protein BN1723_011038 [Verticillium longisporum]
MKITSVAVVALLSATVTAQTGSKWLSYCKGVSQDLGQSLCRKRGGTWAPRTDPPAQWRSRSGFYCLNDGWWGADPCPAEYGQGFELTNFNT